MGEEVEITSPSVPQMVSLATTPGSATSSGVSWGVLYESLATEMTQAAWGTDRAPAELTPTKGTTATHAAAATMGMRRDRRPRLAGDIRSAFPRPTARG